MNPRNLDAVALYSGAIGAFLESTAHNNRWEGHDLRTLQQCREWLLVNNPVFQRNDVRGHIHADDPLPIVHMDEEPGQRPRPPNRPDLVLNPFEYPQHTHNEDFQHNRLPLGTVVGDAGQPIQPSLLRSDPDVEVLCFPHLYPYGQGQWKPGPRTENGRLEYTRHMDIKKKLNSVNSVFRDDWYWPAWAYQEVEAHRIFQNSRRLVRNVTRMDLDNRLAQHQLLQQSNYGMHSIINEELTHTIPSFIRTGENYWLRKERQVSSMIAGRRLPQLFVTLTFNESWPEFEHILRRTTTRLPSNHPWEGVQYFYERIHWLKEKFWRTPLAKIGKLRELVERYEFQLRGAIHTHWLLWTEKQIDQLIEEGFIRADIPDPEREPKLYALVKKYQIHVCKDNICGGPGRKGKCSKGFPCDVSDRTYHQDRNPRYTYKRGPEDRMVSPYNAEMLLLWEGHCNVQYVTSEHLAAYVTKYVTKNEPLSMVYTGGDAAIKNHILARRVGSMEVMVLALGLDLFRCTSGVLYLPTELPQMRQYTVKPVHEVEEDPDDAYYPDALEKYFARPVVYETEKYFDYFQNFNVSRSQIYNTHEPRRGVQDRLGYWVYRREKPTLVRSAYRRLCDGESFFFVHLLRNYNWRSDDEIKGGAETYRERLLTLDPTLFERVMAGHELREQESHIAFGREYLEMVEAVADTTPLNVQDIVSTQLSQLNSMTIWDLGDVAALTLQGDQYECYTTVTQNIQASRNSGRQFFVTGPGGTGKSYLLRALVHWCNTSRESCVLLAPTGIAARNIDGNTIHSAMSIYSEHGSYHTGIFNFDEGKRLHLKKKTVLFIDEVSMVDGRLLDYVSHTFARLKENQLPFGGIHVVLLGDLMQLPPVEGLKVFKAGCWKLFHPLFLRQPQRQRDLRFFSVLNKIRFGIVDEEVKTALRERWQAYNPTREPWTTTHLSSLKDEANAMNFAVLSKMPEGNSTRTSVALDFEEDQRVVGSEYSKLFKRGTNFPAMLTCTPGAKVMFLTNSMLSTKGIANGSIGVITDVLKNGRVDAAFPTKDGIQVRLTFLNLQVLV
jgi:hypothetical protein